MCGASLHEAQLLSPSGPGRGEEVHPDSHQATGYGTLTDLSTSFNKGPLRQCTKSHLTYNNVQRAKKGDGSQTLKKRLR